MNRFSLFNNNIIKDGLEPSASAYYFKTWHGYKMDFNHTHNSIEIMYVMEGSCTVWINNDINNLKKAEFILIDAEVPHRLEVKEDVYCRMLNIEFRFTSSDTEINLLGELVKSNKDINNFLQSRVEYIILKDREELLYSLKDLVLENEHPGRNDELTKQILYCLVLLKIARLWSEKQLRGEVVSATYVKKALSYIYQNYDSQIKIDDIAHSVNINSNYLQRIFKKHMNSTIIQYLLKLRMEKAKLLIANTNIPVTDISTYIGLNSRQYFTYTFKRFYGISPIEFRRRSGIQ